jgi:hypothetical protein
VNTIRSFCLIVVLSLLAGGCAQQFATPGEAAETLVEAVRDGDRPALQRMLGPDYRAIMSTGNESVDQARVQDFLEAYDLKHYLESSADGNAVYLTVGEDDFPLPIPLERQWIGTWAFNFAQAKDEIINRRIGRNELDTMQTCLAIVDAQKEYAAMDAEKLGGRYYAQKFMSDPGKKNGLYWETKEGEAPSPMGAAIVKAEEEGYTYKAGQLNAYHGYYYRILKAQGQAAPGGKQQYVVDGKMMRGFAVIAWPAEYGNTGITTFMVSEPGVVYSKDLGKETETLAAAVTVFDPDDSWRVVATDVLAADK